MKINVEEVTVLKTGENTYGPWALVKIKTLEDEYTTLAEGAGLIEPGSTIEISNMDKNDRGQESFKKFAILSGEQTPAGAQTAPTAPQADEKPPPAQKVNSSSPETNRPREINGQAIGMTTKEIGDMMRANILSAIFGKIIAASLTTWYRSKILAITRIAHDGKDLPKFE